MKIAYIEGIYQTTLISVCEASPQTNIANGFNGKKSQEQNEY